MPLMPRGLETSAGVFFFSKTVVLIAFLSNSDPKSPSASEYKIDNHVSQGCETVAAALRAASAHVAKTKLVPTLRAAKRLHLFGRERRDDFLKARITAQRVP